jgi:hypothetical protein
LTVGTPDYMSPPSRQGKAADQAWTFFIGVSYQLLTAESRHVKDADGPAEVVNADRCRCAMRSAAGSRGHRHQGASEGSGATLPADAGDAAIRALYRL